MLVQIRNKDIEKNQVVVALMYLYEVCMIKILVQHSSRRHEFSSLIESNKYKKKKTFFNLHYLN